MENKEINDVAIQKIEAVVDYIIINGTIKRTKTI